MAPWYLFDSITRKVGSIDITLDYSLLEAIGEGLGEEEAQFIASIDFIFGALAIYGIRVMAKFNGVIY